MKGLSEITFITDTERAKRLAFILWLTCEKFRGELDRKKEKQVHGSYSMTRGACMAGS